MKYFVFISNPQIPEAITNSYYDATVIRKELVRRGYNASIMELMDDDWVLRSNKIRTKIKVKD